MPALRGSGFWVHSLVLLDDPTSFRLWLEGRGQVKARRAVRGELCPLYRGSRRPERRPLRSSANEGGAWGCGPGPSHRSPWLRWRLRPKPKTKKKKLGLKHCHVTHNQSWLRSRWLLAFPLTCQCCHVMRTWLAMLVMGTHCSWFWFWSLWKATHVG